MNKAAYDATFSPFRGFTRDEWSKLEEHPMFPVSDIDLTQLQALNEPLTMQELEEIYKYIAYKLVEKSAKINNILHDKDFRRNKT